MSDTDKPAGGTGISAGSSGNIAGRNVYNYQGQPVSDETPIVRQSERFNTERQLERLDAKLEAATDELNRVRQGLAVSVVTMDGFRGDFKEKIDALTIGQNMMQIDIVALKEAVFRMDNRMSAPPRGISTVALMTIIILGVVVIVVLVSILLLRTG